MGFGEYVTQLSIVSHNSLFIRVTTNIEHLVNICDLFQRNESDVSEPEFEKTRCKHRMMISDFYIVGKLNIWCD